MCDLDFCRYGGPVTSACFNPGACGCQVIPAPGAPCPACERARAYRQRRRPSALSWAVAALAGLAWAVAATVEAPADVPAAPPTVTAVTP